MADAVPAVAVNLNRFSAKVYPLRGLHHDPYRQSYRQLRAGDHHDHAHCDRRDRTGRHRRYSDGHLWCRAGTDLRRLWYRQQLRHDQRQRHPARREGRPEHHAAIFQPAGYQQRRWRLLRHARSRSWPAGQHGIELRKVEFRLRRSRHQCAVVRLHPVCRQQSGKRQLQPDVHHVERLRLHSDRTAGRRIPGLLESGNGLPVPGLPAGCLDIRSDRHRGVRIRAGRDQQAEWSGAGSSSNPPQRQRNWYGRRRRSRAGNDDDAGNRTRRYRRSGRQASQEQEAQDERRAAGLNSGRAS